MVHDPRQKFLGNRLPCGTAAPGYPEMALTDHVTFIVTVLDRQVLTQNLLASPALSSSHSHQILVQEGFASAGQAYNDGLHRAANELVIFMHSDIFLPETWM